MTLVCLSADLRLGPLLAGCAGGQPSTLGINGE